MKAISFPLFAAHSLEAIISIRICFSVNATRPNSKQDYLQFDDCVKIQFDEMVNGLITDVMLACCLINFPPFLASKAIQCVCMKTRSYRINGSLRFYLNIDENSTLNQAVIFFIYRSIRIAEKSRGACATGSRASSISPKHIRKPNVEKTISIATTFPEERANRIECVNTRAEDEHIDSFLVAFSFGVCTT